MSFENNRTEIGEALKTTHSTNCLQPYTDTDINTTIVLISIATGRQTYMRSTIESRNIIDFVALARKPKIHTYRSHFSVIEG